MQAAGYNGTMILADNKITITRKSAGLLTKMVQGLQGDKTIAIQQVTAVQLKEASTLLRGYLRLSINGRDPVGGLTEAVKDENAVIFDKKANQEFAAMRDAIQAQIDAHYARASQPAVAAPSAADELEKFAGLHAKGLITDEEFAAKKKQILGL